MDLNSLVCMSLGLQELIIEKHKFSNDFEKVNIYARLPISSARCHKCYFKFQELHQWQHKTLRIPPIGISKAVYLHLSYPRGFCFYCNKVQASELYFIHPVFKGLSCSFVEYSGRMMEETTCAAVSRLLNIDRKLLWKIDQWRMKYLKDNFELPTSNLDCSKMSADEVHFLTKRYSKKQSPFSPKHFIQYVTNLVCIKHSKVISNALGRDSKALSSCLNVLTQEQIESIEFFSVDMHQDFFSVIENRCENAEIAVDRFHLVQKLNEAFNDLRKEEFAKAKKKKDEFQQGMLEGSRRFMFLERDPVLSIEERNMLGKLKMLNTNISAGMLVVDYFHKVLEQKSLKKFKQKLLKWYKLIREARLPVLTKFASKVRKYRQNIEAYISSRLTTAVSEGLNNKIKVLKRVGYNYTNEESFQNKILQRCGFLNSTYIDTNFLFWHVPTPQI